MRFACPPKNAQAERLPYNVDLIVCVFGPFWRRWLISKFAVPNPAAGVGDVAAGSQSHSAEQNYRNDKWPGRFWPLYRGCDRNRTQNRERVENPDEILGAIPVLIEPGVPVIISHREDAVVSLLAKFVDRPSRDGTNQDKSQRCDLSAPASQKERDDQ